MKRIVALLLVAICVVSFVGCSGGSVATGVYKLESFMGMDIDAANELYGANGGEGSIDELFILELKSGNKAVFTIQGEKAELDYKISGDTITLSGQGESLSGTFKDGKITLSIEGVELIFAKK